MVKLQIFLVILLVSCAHRVPIKKQYGANTLDVYVVAGAQTVRVVNNSGGYTGELLSKGVKGRTKLFLSLAKERMKDFCVHTKNETTYKPSGSPSFLGIINYMGAMQFQSKTKKNETPHMLEWPFECI